MGESATLISGRRWLWCLLILLMVPVAGLAQSAGRGGLTTVMLEPARDNTLYENFMGVLSNGAGEAIFIGRTAGSGQNMLRRALLYFDVAGEIPPGATIESVELSFSVTAIPPLAQACGAALHRVDADWGEGPSSAIGPGGVGAPVEPGDATWLHRFYMDTFWTKIGGDFQAVASATTMVDMEGRYTFASTAQLIADVQSMLDQPQQNFGWIMLGSEAASGNARRLASRENDDPALRPLLVVNYSGGLVLPPPQAVPLFSATWAGLLVLVLLITAAGFGFRNRYT